jgi:hypothetical protein
MRRKFLGPNHRLASAKLHDFLEFLSTDHGINKEGATAARIGIVRISKHRFAGANRAHRATHLRKGRHANFLLLEVSSELGIAHRGVPVALPPISNLHNHVAAHFAALKSARAVTKLTRFVVKRFDSPRVEI